MFRKFRKYRFQLDGALNEYTSEAGFSTALTPTPLYLPKRGRKGALPLLCLPPIKRNMTGGTKKRSQ